MPGQVLTTAGTIACPHGGRAILTTSNTKVAAQGAQALVETDVHPVVGCPFTLPGPKPSPCIRIEWQAGAMQASVRGVPVLVRSSIGLCYSPENAPQGVAIIVSTQPKVSAR
jgi:hypothetical protein